MAGTDKERSKTHFISKTPMKRLMKSQGAEIIGEDALELLIREIEKVGKNITKLAVEIMKDENRKRLTPKDIRVAYQELGFAKKEKEDAEESK